MEKRAGGSQGYSSELKRGENGTTVKKGPGWKLASADLMPQEGTHPYLLVCSVNVPHTGPWDSAVSHILRTSQSK